MSPTFEAGEKVLVLRHWPLKWLLHNAVIVTYLSLKRTFHKSNFVMDGVNEVKISAIPERAVIKRLIGLPGDTIQTTYSFGQEWLVPPAHYFVRSDGTGIDSDILGPIPFDCFQGIVIAKLSTRNLKDVS